MKQFFLIVFILGNIFMIKESQAQVARLVHYQGFHENSDGSPFNGKTELYFSLYRSQQSQKALWSEVHKNVEISAGNYQVLLGSQNPLKLSFYEYYLEVKVEGEEVAGPKIEIVGSGYNYRLNFLFAAYTIVWLAIFLYLLSISRRQKKLISELEVLAKGKTI